MFALSELLGALGVVLSGFWIFTAFGHMQILNLVQGGGACISEFLVEVFGAYLTVFNYHNLIFSYTGLESSKAR